jgi:hypothetical protein
MAEDPRVNSVDEEEMGDVPIFLDGLYAPDRDGKGFMFHPAPASTQEDVEAIVERASKRILRFLQRRGVITLVTAPGDGEVTVVTDETMGEEDPLIARLLAAATAGAPPAGPVNKRNPMASRHFRPRSCSCASGAQASVVVQSCTRPRFASLMASASRATRSGMVGSTMA